MKKTLTILSVVFLLLIVLAEQGKEAPASTPEVRALWVIRTSLTSPEKITEMVRRAKNSNFNTLIVQVRGRGDAYYHSRWEPRAEELKGTPETFDPLALAVEEAHKACLKIHAWINMGFISEVDRLPSSPEHVVNRHPEWLMVHRGVSSRLQRLEGS